MPQESPRPTDDTLPVVPIHHTREGGPIIESAWREVIARDEYAESTAQLASDIARLQELRDLPPRRNIFKRLKQQRDLAKWLEHKGYADADEAHAELSMHHSDHVDQRDARIQSIEQVWLPRVRSTLGGLHEDDKKYADKLFRAHEFPGDALEACEEQAAATGKAPNLLDWISQEPSDENPFGATNKQLESILMWNASCTERMAANMERTSGMVIDFMAKIDKKVAQGELDESWSQKKPDISQIVVGDILDVRFLGYEDIRRHGSYTPDHTLTLWPYELEEENDVQHTCEHECSHALGGFKNKWLDEGFTEIFTRIANDQDPFGDGIVYTMNRHGIKKLLDGAGVTCTEASAFFIGKDGAGNEAKLREYLTRAYDGNDVLGVIDAAYRESFGDNALKLHILSVAEDAFFVATITATAIGDLYKEAQQDASGVAERVKELAMHTKSDLRFIALKHAYHFFADLAAAESKQKSP